MSFDKEIEAEIIAKGKTAPRISVQHIESVISSEHYFTAYDGAKHNASYQSDPKNAEALKLLTFCVLVLKNGFTVTGQSACASPENFDEEIGRKIARGNAVQEIWKLEGYLLRDQLSKG